MQLWCLKHLELQLLSSLDPGSWPSYSAISGHPAQFLLSQMSKCEQACFHEKLVFLTLACFLVQVGTRFDMTFYYCPNRKRIQQRLGLYQGVCPIYIEFLADAEETFANALSLLNVRFHLYALLRPSSFILLFRVLVRESKTFIVMQMYRSKEWWKKVSYWLLFKVAINLSGNPNRLTIFRSERYKWEWRRYLLLPLKNQK